MGIMWQSLPDMFRTDTADTALAATGASLRREAETLALMASWYTDPRDVRAGRRYGHDVSASSYGVEDRNGMSIGIIRDVPLRNKVMGRKTAPTEMTHAGPVRVRPLPDVVRYAGIIGQIGNVE